MSLATNVREGYISQLAALIQGASWWLHLYTNDPPVSPELVRADMTEIVYDGYTPQPLVRWTAPSLRAGIAAASADTVMFTWVAGPVPLPVRGYYITSTRDGPLVSVWRKPGPAFPFGPGHALLMVNVAAEFPPPA